jgi:hypothetical protein
MVRLRSRRVRGRLIPSAFSPDDPTPYRTVVFGIHASQIEGRASSTESSGALIQR